MCVLSRSAAGLQLMSPVGGGIGEESQIGFKFDNVMRSQTQSTYSKEHAQCKKQNKTKTIWNAVRLHLQWRQTCMQRLMKHQNVESTQRTLNPEFLHDDG